MSPREHTAKVWAIEALEASRLSAAGRARVLAHVERCEVCSATQRAVRAHTALRRELSGATPVLDFARIERALRSEAQALSAQKRRARVLWPATAVALAAVVLLAVLLHQRTGDDERSTTARTQGPSGAPSAVSERATWLRGAVTVLRGNVLVRGADGQARPLTLDSEVVEGDRLELAADAEVHLRFADRTGLLAEAGARLRLARLRADTVQLELDAGSVTSQVRKLGPRERYEVLARGHTVAVRGTRFRVSVDDDAQLTAAVDEGRIVVLDAASGQIADLIAPASFELRKGGVSAARLPLPAPRLLSLPLSAWPALTIPRLDGVTAWTVDGQRFAASGELRMRVPRGDLTLRAELSTGQSRELLVAVPEGGRLLEQATLRQLLRDDDEDPHAGALEPGAIREVLTGGMPALSRCYELSLKQRPDVAGRLVLRITVDGGGRVKRVVPRTSDEAAASVPPALVDCIRNSALRWQFPAPGGAGLTFDAPIRLAQGR